MKHIINSIYCALKRTWVPIKESLIRESFQMEAERLSLRSGRVCVSTWDDCEKWREEMAKWASQPLWK